MCLFLLLDQAVPQVQEVLGLQVHLQGLVVPVHQVNHQIHLYQVVQEVLGIRVGLQVQGVQECLDHPVKKIENFW